VGKLSSVRLPLFLADFLSKGIERYHTCSKAQIPLVLTPYRVRSSWKGHTYSNAKLKSTGWQQAVPTQEAISRSLKHFSLHRSSSFETDRLH
jgi:hypothetical protein